LEIWRRKRRRGGVGGMHGVLARESMLHAFFNGKIVEFARFGSSWNASSPQFVGDF
jgi:hypothetical protein